MLTTTNNRIMLNDTAYELGKKAVQIWLPAFSTLYFVLAQIWGLPAAEQVVGTIAAVTTFLGVTLGISSKQYDKSGAAYGGVIEVETADTGRKIFSLVVDGDPEEIERQSAITFKVNRETKQP